jgi:hypothetical protein
VKRALEYIQAFPIPEGIPNSREQCESSVFGMEGSMARAYSQDLRDRVIECGARGNASQAAGSPIRDRDRHGDCVGTSGARER